MSFTTPQLDCATAVAELLDGREIAGFTLRARAIDQDPTYEKKDLTELKIDCVAATPFDSIRVDRQTVSEGCPVNVGVQYACEKDDEPMKARLKFVCLQIKRILEGNRLATFGYPREDVEIEEDPIKRMRGHWMAVVSALYRIEVEVAS